MILKALRVFDGKARKKFDSEEAHKAFSNDFTKKFLEKGSKLIFFVVSFMNEALKLLLGSIDSKLAASVHDPMS